MSKSNDFGIFHRSEKQYDSRVSFHLIYFSTHNDSDINIFVYVNMTNYIEGENKYIQAISGLEQNDPTLTFILWVFNNHGIG